MTQKPERKKNNPSLLQNLEDIDCLKIFERAVEKAIAENIRLGVDSPELYAKEK